MQAQDHGKRRGRKPVRPDPDSGAAGAFADRLLRLKEEAGDPSYAEMSSRLGAAASKSSLASAAQGRKLPTWETTWEFVHVLAVQRLGRDPEETEHEWRRLWEEAKAATVPATTGTEAPPAPPPPGPATWNRALVGVVAAAAVVVAVMSVVAVRLMANHDDPVTPPAVASATGDDSEFVGDVTYPDGTEVRQGSSFVKVWRIRDIGTIPWKGRRLARINDAAPCRSPESVSIPPTAPGRTVDIAVRVQAPKKAGECLIYWKMTNSHGGVLFPDKRPVYLDVHVGGSTPHPARHGDVAGNR